MMVAIANAINTKRVNVNDKATWGKPERPIGERAPLSFLFLLKSQLVGWRYTKKQFMLMRIQHLRQYSKCLFWKLR